MSDRRRIAGRAALACALVLASCSQLPAPVRYGGDGAVVSPPLPAPPPGDGVAAVPPLPRGKPARTVAALTVSLPGTLDLIAHIERILLADENLPERAPVVPETVSTDTGSVQVVTIRSGDTLSGLSRSLGVPARDIAQANDLASPYVLIVGQRLEIPGTGAVSEAASAEPDGSPHKDDIAPAKPSADVITAAVGVSATVPEPVNPASREDDTAPLKLSGDAAAAVTRAPATVPEPGQPAFIWPVEGSVISTFGPKSEGLRNDGINIAAGAGTPVRAAEDGVVAYVGDELRGYGNLVLLRHADGWVTVYGHNARNLVVHGQTVLRGDVIASVGASGGVARPQSHFEIRKGTEAVDPLAYLDGG